LSISKYKPFPVSKKIAQRKSPKINGNVYEMDKIRDLMNI